MSVDDEYLTAVGWVQGELVIQCPCGLRWFAGRMRNRYVRRCCQRDLTESQATKLAQAAERLRMPLDEINDMLATIPLKHWHGRPFTLP